MKMSGKYIIILFFIAIGIQTAHSQERINRPFRDKIQAQRIAFITSRMNLTPEEAQKFWPVYNEYVEKKQTLQDKKIQLLKAFKNKTLSDAEMDEALTKYVQINKSESTLLEEYTQKMRQVLPPQKVIKLYIAQEEFMNYLLRQIRERGKKADGIQD